MQQPNQLLPLLYFCHLLNVPSFSKDFGKWLTFSSSKALSPVLVMLTSNSSNILSSQHSDLRIFNGLLPTPPYLPPTWALFPWLLRVRVSDPEPVLPWDPSNPGNGAHALGHYALELSSGPSFLTPSKEMRSLSQSREHVPKSPHILFLDLSRVT